MTKRQVSSSTFIKLFLEGRPYSVIGLIFTLLTLIMLPVLIFVTSSLREPYEKYDYKEIAEKGTDVQGTVTYIEDVTNVTINNRHPVKIFYVYNNGTQVTDTFETIDLEQVAHLNTGDAVTIQVLDGESKIKGIEPFIFPFYLFLLIPLPFLVAGVIFLLKGLLPALKKLKLFKNGTIKDAVITSLSMHSKLLVGQNEYLLVTYYHIGKAGLKVFGDARTTDFSILGQKKPDDTIKIFVSEEDESKSCLIPQLEAQKNNWNISF